MTLNRRGPPLGTRSDHQKPPELVRRKWRRNPCTTGGNAPPTSSPPEWPLLPSEKRFLHQPAQPDTDKVPLFAGHLAQYRSRRDSGLCRPAWQQAVLRCPEHCLRTDLNPPGLPTSLDLMEQPWFLRRNRSWRDGPNTFTVSSTAPLRSTTRPLNIFHKLRWTWNSTLPQRLKKWWKPSRKCPPGTPQDRTKSLPRFTRLVALSFLTRSPTSFSPSWTKSNYPKSSETPQSSTSTSAKETGIPATIIALCLFSPFLAISETGIRIRNRLDGKLFNLRRLQAVTKVKETVIRDFLFAEDCALNDRSEQEIPLEMDRLSKACDNFGLTISTKKDWSGVSASSQQPIPGPHHHSQKSETPGCLKFHLPWYHPLTQHNLKSQQCVWAVQEDSLREEMNSPCHQTQSLKSSSPHHPPVLLGDLDCLQASRKAD